MEKSNNQILLGSRLGSFHHSGIKVAMIGRAVALWAADEDPHKESSKNRED